MSLLLTKVVPRIDLSSFVFWMKGFFIYYKESGNNDDGKWFHSERSTSRNKTDKRLF